MTMTKTKPKITHKIVPVEPFKAKLEEYLQLISNDYKVQFMQGEMPIGFWPVDSTCLTHEYPNASGDNSDGPEFAVWKFSEGEVSYAYKFSGHYSSYNGSEFSHYKEVKPVVKTLTVWE